MIKETNQIASDPILSFVAQRLIVADDPILSFVPPLPTAMPSWRSLATVDRIGDLPDSLLYHILSFLPIKLAVATSVLSKRWKSLWQSALTLDFGDGRFTDFASFRHFVYSVIISRDAVLPNRSFRIRCGKSESFDTRDLNQHCQEFNCFPNLVRANFSGDLYHFPFAWFRNAKYLRAELWSAYEYDVPPFHNLTDIELIFRSNSWEDAKWKWVIQVLQHCPKLQNLTIDEADKSELIIHDGGWEDPETIPECLLSQLRTCYLPDFRGNECEHRFVEYVLLNSKLLNTMTIRSDYPGVDEDAKLEIALRLSACCRGSRTCSIVYDE